MTSMKTKLVNLIGGTNNGRHVWAYPDQKVIQVMQKIKLEKFDLSSSIIAESSECKIETYDIIDIWEGKYHSHYEGRLRT